MAALIYSNRLSATASEKPALPTDPALIMLRLAWRYRHELSPFYAALGLATIAGLAHDYASRLWLLALPLGAGITAACS